MSITIGLAGKPNSGKSTFFKASTMVDVEIANYPFTTINANKGVTFVRTECQCTLLDKKCGNCIDGNRFIPINIIDVAGLVPDAHKGRGLGNKFLDELRQAQAIIHVIDASGGTDIEGNPVKIGEHNPLDDIDFLNHEMSLWMFSILKRDWIKLSRKINAEGLKIEEIIASKLLGAGVTEEQVHEALMECNFKNECTKWEDKELMKLMFCLQRISKPMIIAANKSDIAPKNYIEKLKQIEGIVVQTSAASEFALKTAAKIKVIKYLPGDLDFSIISDKLNDAQKKGLESIHKFIKQNKGSGVQQCINKAVFGILGLIVVYPVEDEGKWIDKNERILPDAFLMKKNETVQDLAYHIHSDIGDCFLYAIDAKTKMRLGKKHILKNGDVIKIVSTAK